MKQEAPLAVLEVRWTNGMSRIMKGWERIFILDSDISLFKRWSGTIWELSNPEDASIEMFA